MGRPSKPWYWAARKRWAATVEGVRHTAPARIRRRDEHAAWEWHRALLESAGAEPGTAETVAEICETYLAWDEERAAAGERDARSQRLFASELTRICATPLGGVPLGDARAANLGAGTIEDLAREWASEGLAPGYRRKLAASLKTVLSWAARPRGDRSALLPASPLADAPLPPAPVVPERFADRSEAAAWLRFLWRDGRRDFAVLQRCLIHTGARPSELTSAAWGQVRWDAERGTSGHPVAVLTLTRWKASRKTGRARRIYLTSRVRRCLLRRWDRCGDVGARLFSTPSGKPWNASNLSSYTTRHRGRAIASGVPASDEGPDRLTCYRWRHTAASSLLMAGVPIATVAELLGTSVGMISRVYGHLLGGHLGRAAEAIGRKT